MLESVSVSVHVCVSHPRPMGDDDLSSYACVHMHAVYVYIAFNESSSIVNALDLLALLSIILLPINFIVDDNVNALALIRYVYVTSAME